MIIYKRIKKFNRDTGAQAIVKVFDHYRCDYSGEKINEYDDLKATYCNYELNYGNQDPCFGASRPEYDLYEEYGIDTHDFLSQTYHFIAAAGSCNEQEFEELNMMKEAIVNVDNTESPWYGCFTFDGMCRIARVLTAQKLLESKVVEPWQLTETDEEDDYNE